MTEQQKRILARSRRHYAKGQYRSAAMLALLAMETVREHDNDG